MYAIRTALNYQGTKMRGRERLAAISSSTPRLKRQLPDVPVDIVALMRTVRAANQALTTFLDSLLRPLGVAESLMHTLLVLFTAPDGSSTPRALCDQVGQTPANMTRVLLALSELGFISRHTDRSDGRRQQVRITARGRDYMRRVVPQLSDPLRRAVHGLTAREVAQSTALLSRLAAALDDAERDQFRALGTARRKGAMRASKASRVSV